MPVKVGEAIKLVEADGWRLNRTRGGHRQYRHPTKAGVVTIAGKAVGHVAPEDLEQHHASGGTCAMSKRRYLIVVEGGTGPNYSAYAPDLPGCVATGATLEACRREMRDAVEFHIEGLRDAGVPVPEPSDVTAMYVSVAA